MVTMIVVIGLMNDSVTEAMSLLLRPLPIQVVVIILKEQIFRFFFLIFFLN